MILVLTFTTGVDVAKVEVNGSRGEKLLGEGRVAHEGRKAAPFPIPTTGPLDWLMHSLPHFPVCPWLSFPLTFSKGRVRGFHNGKDGYKSNHLHKAMIMRFVDMSSFLLRANKYILIQL